MQSIKKEKKRKPSQQTIIQTKPIINLIIFPSLAHEQTFKKCLTKIQTIGKTWNDEQSIVIALRPKEFTKFRYHLNQTALEHCNFTQKLVKFVEDDITKYFQFVHFKY